MPLTVTRTGGFAGFDDRVVLGADGIASISRRGQTPVRCRVEPGLFNTVIAPSAGRLGVGRYDEADGQAPGRHDHRDLAGGGLPGWRTRKISRW